MTADNHKRSVFYIPKTKNLGTKGKQV